jgi:LacI family transcriptional regulator
LSNAERAAAVADITIRDVARKAEVSVTTVSRVMNGNTRVNAELARRVRRVVEELGYRPSATARSLVAGRTGLIGVLVPDLANPFYPSVLKGLSFAAEESGYSLVVASTGEQYQHEMPVALRLLAQTDGLVLLSPRMSTEALQEIAAIPRPVVCVNRFQAGIAMRCVTVDEYDAALSLAGHLRGLGHKRIAYLRGPARSWSDGERWRALRAAAAFGLEVLPLDCGADLENGFKAVDRLIDLDVTAAVAFNDYVALGVMSGLQAAGVRVPQDFSVAGFDDIPFAAYSVPPLTSVRRPVGDLGREAWRKIEAEMLSEPLLDTAVLSSTIVPRGSTAEPPRRSSSTGRP